MFTVGTGVWIFQLNHDLHITQPFALTRKYEMFNIIGGWIVVVQTSMELLQVRSASKNMLLIVPAWESGVSAKCIQLTNSVSGCKNDVTHAHWE